MPELFGLVPISDKQALNLVRRLSGKVVTSPPPSDDSAVTMLRLVAAMAPSADPCSLATPPEPINRDFDDDGNMIYRCSHTPPHRWKLDGTKL